MLPNLRNKLGTQGDLAGVRFRRNFMGGIGRLLTLKLSDWVAIEDFLTDGSDPATVTDWYPILMKAIGSLPNRSKSAWERTYYRNLGTITFLSLPQYHFGQGIVAEWAVHLMGTNPPGGNSLGGTRFTFPDNVRALHAKSRFTSSTGQGCTGMKLECITFCPQSYNNTTNPVPVGAFGSATYDGLLIQDRITVIDCCVAGFNGRGFKVVATAPTAWGPSYTYNIDDNTLDGGGNPFHSIQDGNVGRATTDTAWWAPGLSDKAGIANGFKVDGLTVMDCGSDGWYVEGADANAGSVKHIDVRNCGGSGMYDRSTLGNGYFMTHVSACGKRAIVSHGGHAWQCLSDTLGHLTTPGTNPAVWYDLGTGGPYGPAWSSSGNYMRGHSYRTDNINGRCGFYWAYEEQGYAPASLSDNTTHFGGINDFDRSPFCSNFYFYDGRLRVANGEASRPFLTTVSDKISGFFQIGSASGIWGWSSLGNVRGRLGNGWAKWSTDGTYWNETQDACEAVQTNASIHSFLAYAKTTVYTGFGIWSRSNTAAGTGFNLFTGTNAGADCFKVLGNGNVQNTTGSYGSISDPKHKDILGPANRESAWAAVKAYQWIKYTLKANPDAGVMMGLNAAQAAQVSPAVVYQTPDYEEVDGERVPTGTTSMAVKYSVVGMQGDVALQWAIERIEALEAEVRTLKGL